MLMIRALYNCSVNVTDLAVKISKSLPWAGYLASLCSALLSLSSEISLATTSGWSSEVWASSLGSSELFSLDVN